MMDRDGDTTDMELQCACGQVRFTACRRPLLSLECCCTSCRTAGGLMERLPGAPRIVRSNGATPLILFRKDRVHFTRGTVLLKEYRLKPESPTRRVIAQCCNTPIFVDFTRGHWLSLYAGLWPADRRPPPRLRTMAVDVPQGTILSEDIPNHRRFPIRLLSTLLIAWAAMGFKSPAAPG